MGQGFRFFSFSANSFTVGHTEWIYYGAGSFLLIIFSRPSEEA